MTQDNQDAVNETFEIELDVMAHGGSPLGRHGKKTVFVPYTIPGEKVEARITQDRGRVAFAEGVRLIEASADRVFPQCRHFGPGRCGRCQWQHINYDAQVMLKFDVLADQLGRIGKFDDATLERVLQPVIASGEQWSYNHHMTLFVTEAGELGFRSTDGEGITVMEECHLIHTDLLEMYHQLDLDVSGIEKVKLMRGDNGDVMLVISVQNEEEMPELETDLPISINAVLPDNEPINLIGSSHVIYHINGREFRVTAGSEFRANVRQIPALIETVVNALDLHSDAAVLDLYAGVGVFSAFIAPHAALVTLVDSYPPAVTDADENLTEFDNVDIIEATVEEILEDLDDDYDAVIVDPPSEGLSLEVMDALAALQIPKLVYVSSDPATLARDANRLTIHGYQLVRVQPIDLSPQTYYIDSVAVFEWPQ